LFFAPRTVLPSTRDHQSAAGVHGPGQQPGAENPVQRIGADQRERPAERGLLRWASRRAQHGQDLRAGIGAHCPIAANDLDPAITAAIPTASSPASGCRRPRLFRRVRDLGKEIEKVLAAGSRNRRRCHRRAGVSRGKRR